MKSPPTRMPWRWRDPSHVTHYTHKNLLEYGSVSRIHYRTDCGIDLTVDDINNRTKVVGDASCLRCAIAPPIPDMVEGT